MKLTRKVSLGSTGGCECPMGAALGLIVETMLYDKHVPIAESALLVIDAQDSFKLGPRWECRDNKDFEKNVARLIDAYRRHGLPIFFFLHIDPDPGFRRDSPECRLMDFITPLPDEPIIPKVTRNVFTSTGLPEMLLAKGVRRVVITGIQMEQCCETSTRVAADLGYAVDFVTEGTMTFPILNRDKPGEELSVEAIKERTEYVLRGRFARIVNVEDIAGELAEIGPEPAAQSDIFSRA